MKVFALTMHESQSGTRKFHKDFPNKPKDKWIETGLTDRNKKKFLFFFL